VVRRDLGPLQTSSVNAGGDCCRTAVEQGRGRADARDGAGRERAFLAGGCPCGREPHLRQQLLDANARLRDLLGVTPEVFAYPCGQTFVGRGLDARSYVPLVAAAFVAGRGWLGEAPNDPQRCDLAQVLGMEMETARPPLY
jgi:hypothetical protein